MEDALAELMCPRRGHFLLASGHHGDLWLDLDHLFLRPAALAAFVDALAGRLGPHLPDVVCGPATGGAYLALLLAARLDVDFAPAEPGLPSPSSVSTFRGRRVAVVDDAINAGSAVRQALAQVRAGGGTPVVLAALVVLGSPAADLAAAEHLPLVTLAHLPAHLWPPSSCPLCAAGQPLQ